MTHPPAPALLRGKASWLVGRIATHTHRVVGETLAGVDAHGHHFAVLAALQEYGPASQAAVGTCCLIDRSDVVAAVNELADQGLVVRSLDLDDRRRNVVTITAAGIRRLEQLDAVLGTVQDDLFAALDAEERRHLVDLLGRVLDSCAASH